MVFVNQNAVNKGEMGTRTIMMDAGRIILDITGEERRRMTVPGLLERFRAAAERELDNDRMMLD